MSARAFWPLGHVRAGRTDLESGFRWYIVPPKVNLLKQHDAANENPHILAIR